MDPFSCTSYIPASTHQKKKTLVYSLIKPFKPANNHMTLKIRRSIFFEKKNLQMSNAIETVLFRISYFAGFY